MQYGNDTSNRYRCRVLKLKSSLKNFRIVVKYCPDELPERGQTALVFFVLAFCFVNFSQI